MTIEERDIEMGIRFRVVRNDLANARAFYDDRGRRVIEVFVGLIRATEIFSDARAYVRINRHSDAGDGYINYVIKEIQSRLSRGILGKEAGEIQSFAQFIGMSESQYRQFRSHPIVSQHLEFEMNASLMWIVGHELGHHIRGHVDSPKLPPDERRALEEEADDVGFRLMRDSGYNALGTVPIILAFAVWDPEAHRFEGSRTHPSPLRRLKRNLEAGFLSALNEPGFEDYLRQSGKMKEFRDEMIRDRAKIDNILALP